MKSLVFKAFLSIAVLMALVVGIVEAAERIRFARGTSGTTLEDGVARGETRTYLLGARAGQTMEVSISSAENNAVFQIYRPNGRAMGGARPGDDATYWANELPQSGDYRIVVGSTRGGADYALTVAITN